jgi:hypothetical protein
MALRPPDPNENEPRYTTVAAVKERLEIPDTDLSRDDQIKQAIVSGEYAIDVFCGRGFPDLTDPEDPAVILVVPTGVADAALQLAIAIWKEADAPTGTAGSDAFFGAMSVSETSRQLLERNALLVSYRVSWGVA